MSNKYPIFVMLQFIVFIQMCSLQIPLISVLKNYSPPTDNHQLATNIDSHESDRVYCSPNLQNNSKWNINNRCTHTCHNPINQLPYYLSKTYYCVLALYLSAYISIFLPKFSATNQNFPTPPTRSFEKPLFLYSQLVVPSLYLQKIPSLFIFMHSEISFKLQLFNIFLRRKTPYQRNSFVKKLSYQSGQQPTFKYLW
eukprot:TRINITY_DN1699_c0_g3_i8.p1 TRINITY_DN1699_c0_g3~~TRINITY_DN1699_c0_g3_i8.p1  ORF type:complete len:197 (+),score=-14.88 TRINITY_DN1699_c0_g3_i8:1-591(+)